MTEDFLIDPEDIDGITEEEYEQLEEYVEEYQELCREFDDDLDEILEKINNSALYEKLGKRIHVNIEYLYEIESVEE